MKTKDIVDYLRDLADEIERRGVEEGDDASVSFQNGIVEITDHVEEQSGLDVEWKCYVLSGHVSLHLKFRYADWKDVMQQAIVDEIKRLINEPRIEEANP